MLLSALLKSALVLAVANSLVSAADLPYGNIIRSCTVTNTFALTFDDGPSNFTRQLLQRLKGNGLKATFFVVCLNAKREGPLVRQILQEGHQIASHTYSHPFLTSLSEDLVRSQMTDLDAVLIKTIGKAPTFMRPPYYDTNDKVLQILKGMQYHVINSDIDTNDWNFTKPENNDEAFRNLEKGLKVMGSIVLMHDVHATTVNQLVPKAIPLLKQTGKKFVTVGECLGVPREQWYREKSVAGKETSTEKPHGEL